MEAAAASVGKAVLNGLLSGAKSAIAEESTLTQVVKHDMVFLADELEEMHSTLRDVDEEQNYHKIPRNRVRQLRILAHEVEDCLQEYYVHLEKPSGWRLARTMLERHRIAAEMKGLRARVEDMNQRNLHYQLIHRPGSKAAGATTTTEQSKISASPTKSSIYEARRFAKQDKWKVDLDQLIDQGVKELRVIAIWGKSVCLGQMSIIRAAYENLYIKGKFSCREWVRVMQPFNPKDFVQSLVKQFHSATGVNVFLHREKTLQELIDEFNQYVNDRFLVVLNGLSTIEEWDDIKTCFPNNMKGSRIIVCTSQVEVASLCAGEGSFVSELNQLSDDQTIYAFYKMDSQDNEATSTTEIMEGGDEPNVARKGLTRIKSVASALGESPLIGRRKEISDMIELISVSSETLSVISVWGMSGVGKTTLVKAVYERPELISMFQQRAYVTMSHPLILEEVLKSLLMQLMTGTLEKMGAIDFGRGKRNVIAMLRIDALCEELTRVLERKTCLIVLDDLSSAAEWDLIKYCLSKMHTASRIVVTTREENIAKYCSHKQYKLKVLEYNDALGLFIRKVFKEAIDLEEDSELEKQAKLILKKCNRLPLAIVTIGGLLAFRPKTAMEWRKLNKCISTDELETNPEIYIIRTVLDKSYDGLPYHMKPCFLYFSIFSEDHKVRRRRLVQRWVAEGYSREIRGRSAEEIANIYFMELIDRSMIIPSQQSIHCIEGIDSCQVHDLMREVGISKSAEKNLVFILEEGCSSNNQSTAVHHLAISRNWNGNKSEFENAVNLSRIRSLTVFGKWREFFISDKMRLLRVLDLEGTSGLVDHHLQHIGKFLHLKYLSLRGCHGIYHLPDSVGNLVHMQTLDIKNTRIIKLPKAIVRLRKLQYLRAGCLGLFGANSYDEIVDDLPKLLRNKLCLLTLISVQFCLACWAPQATNLLESDGDMNRRDVCTFYFCNALPFMARRLDPFGVVMPSGVNKLTALHTLGTVNIRQGKTILRDIRSISTNLRKLGVTGINEKNGQEFCSTLVHLSRLESLSLMSTGEPGLHSYLDGCSWPPKNLQVLKVDGSLFKLPYWIMCLHNLVKLKLERTKLSELDATIGVLGKLTNLAILRLLKGSFEGEELHLTFPRWSLPSLMVLQLSCIRGLRLVMFEEGTTPKLELLCFVGYSSSDTMFSGLANPPRLKEFTLDNGDCYKEEFLEDVLDQLARNPNGPVLKRLSIHELY